MVLLDHLRRVTRDGRWIPEVDGIRFVAIAAVFLFHIGGNLTVRPEYHLPVEPRYWWLTQMVSNGDRGVPLFFVISGLILSLPFARHLLTEAKPVSLGKYYLRRVTRLEPPYIASLIFCTFAKLVYWHHLGPGYWAHFLASLLYQHNLIYGQLSTVNLVAWSLEVEIQFYMLAPLIVQVYRVRPAMLRRAILLAGILGISWAQVPFQSLYTVNRFELSILFYVQYFLMGLLIADIFVLDLDKMKSRWAWDAAGILALVAIFWPDKTTFWPHALMPLPIGAFCLATMRSYVLRRILGNAWVAVIGGMCYSIYLLHFTFLAAVMKITWHLARPSAGFLFNYVEQVILVGVPTLILCAIFFLLVERPCMDPDWPSMLWRALTGGRGHEVKVLDTADVAK